MGILGRNSRGEHSRGKPERWTRREREPKLPREARSGAGRGKVIAAILGIVAAAVVLAGAVGVIAINRVDTVFPNVKFDGMDIGGMSGTQLLQLLVDEGYEDTGDEVVTVKLPLDYEIKVSAQDVCTAADAAGIVDSVMNACHDGSPMAVAVRYLRCMLGGVKLESSIGTTVDAAAVQAAVENVVKELKLELMSSEVTVGDDSIKVMKGASSVKIDPNEICSLITDAFLNENYETIVYDAEVSGESKLDLQKLYDTVCCEPKNAEYDPEAGEVKPETVGLSFDMKNAQRLWDDAEYGDEVVIPLIVTQPEVNAEQLESMLFSHCFCTKATSLAGSSANRVNNVSKAAEAINGTILMPGQEFSYNDALGKRTAERGYLMAGAYSGGQTVSEYGGGICQVSSTLYYCALYANLEITARTCHMFPVAYLPAGLDATVSWGGPEFKFVNNRNYPVKIVSFVEDNQVTVEIWGTDEDGSYVEMTYGTYLVYDEEYTDVAIGYKAVTRRKIYDKDGNLISNEIEANSTYNYHEEDIKWPEEAEQPEVTPVPEVTPTPEPTPEVSVEPTVEPEPTVGPEPTPTPPAETDVPVATGEPEVTPTQEPTVEPTPEPEPEPEPVEPTEPVDSNVGFI